jgi:hypothetical protein
LVIVMAEADNHGIQLLIKGASMWKWKSSVNTSTGSFDNMSYGEIYKKCMGAGEIPAYGLRDFR